MNSYSEIDGLPVAADAGLLTGVLRDEWGFEGVRGLATTGRSRSRRSCTGSPARAGGGGRAVAGGGHRRRAPAHAVLRRAARASWCAPARCRRRSSTAPRGACCGRRPSSGCSTPDWSPTSPAMAAARSTSTRPTHRALARELAEAPSVLLENDGTLPLASARRPWRSSAPAPTTRSRSSAATRSPTTASWRAIRTSGSASRSRRCWTRLRAELPASRSCTSPAARSRTPDRSRLAAAADAARAADVCVAVVGDRPGPVRARHLGRGLRRRGPLAARGPGRAARRAARDRHAGRARRRLRAAVCARPLRGPARPPPSRRSCPARRAGRRSPACSPGASCRRASCPCRSRAAPARSRAPTCIPILGGNSGGVEQHRPDAAVPLRPRPARTRRFGYSDFSVAPRRSPPTARWRCPASCTTRATARAPRSSSSTSRTRCAQVTRPVIELAGFARVELEPGQRTRVTLHACTPTGRRSPASTSAASSSRVRSACWSARRATDIRGGGAFRLTGEPRVVGHDRVLTTPVRLG